MTRFERGSALVVATIVVLIIAVVGVSILRFSSREAAGASSGMRQTALVTCADAARQLLVSRFHLLGRDPTAIEVLDVRLDGPDGRLRGLGGHIDADPSLPLVTIAQVKPLASGATEESTYSADITNRITGDQSTGAGAGLGGTPIVVTVHCQEGDHSSPTSGRQLEIELGVRFGL
jgi:hypothetical protein